MKEYMLKIIVNENDDVAEELIEYFDDGIEEDEVSIEINDVTIPIPKDVVKAFNKLNSNILGIT